MGPPVEARAIFLRTGSRVRDGPPSERLCYVIWLWKCNTLFAHVACNLDELPLLSLLVCVCLCWWCFCSGAQRSCAQEQSRLKSNRMIILELSWYVCMFTTRAPTKLKWNAVAIAILATRLLKLPVLLPPSLAVIMAAAHADFSNNASTLADVVFLSFLPLRAEPSASSIIQTTQQIICNPIFAHRHGFTIHQQYTNPVSVSLSVLTCERADHSPQTPSFRYLTALCEAGIYPQWPRHPLAGERILDDNVHNTTLWPCARHVHATVAETGPVRTDDRYIDYIVSLHMSP